MQGLVLAAFLPGGMNFMRHSNPPGSDRRAGRLWPQGPQHYRPGPPQRAPRLAFARHPGRSRLRPSWLAAAAAKAMISPAADPFSASLGQARWGERNIVARCFDKYVISLIMMYLLNSSAECLGRKLFLLVIKRKALFSGNHLKINIIIRIWGV